MLYEGWKTRRRKALPGRGLEVFVKDMDKGRRGGVGLTQKLLIKGKSPHTFVTLFFAASL